MRSKARTALVTVVFLGCASKDIPAPLIDPFKQVEFDVLLGTRLQECRQKLNFLSKKARAEDRGQKAMGFAGGAISVVSGVIGTIVTTAAKDNEKAPIIAAAVVSSVGGVIALLSPLIDKETLDKSQWSLREAWYNVAINEMDKYINDDGKVDLPTDVRKELLSVVKKCTEAKPPEIPEQYKSASTAPAASTADPSVSTANQAGACTFRIDNLPDHRLVFGSRDGGLSEACQTISSFKCAGTKPEGRYVVTAVGTATVNTSKEAEFGSWPRWIEMKIKVNGEVGDDCTAFPNSYNVEVAGAHEINLCAAKDVGKKTEVVAELCFHRCKQGDAAASCVLDKEFTVSIRPE